MYKILSQVSGTYLMCVKGLTCGSCTCVKYMDGMTCDFYNQDLGMLVFSMGGSAGVGTPLGSMELQEQCVTSAVPEIPRNSAGDTSLMMCTAQGFKVNNGQSFSGVCISESLFP